MLSLPAVLWMLSRVLPLCGVLLMQVEAQATAAADVLEAAKDLLRDQPDGLLQRLVLQVMQLHGVEQLDGLPAAVNRVRTRDAMCGWR